LSLKAAQAEAVTSTSRGQGRLFYSLMACGKYEILYTDVLDSGTWNLMEWSHVLYSYGCCVFWILAHGT
jgi:hypothetical protein